MVSSILLLLRTLRLGLALGLLVLLGLLVHLGLRLWLRRPLHLLGLRRWLPVHLGRRLERRLLLPRLWRLSPGRLRRPVLGCGSRGSRRCHRRTVVLYLPLPGVLSLGDAGLGALFMPAPGNCLGFPRPVSLPGGYSLG